MQVGYHVMAFRKIWLLASNVEIIRTQHGAVTSVNFPPRKGRDTKNQGQIHRNHTASLLKKRID